MIRHRLDEIGPRPRPALDERLHIRFPVAFRAGAAGVFALSHGSRLRAEVLVRTTTLSYQAQNRGDWRFAVIPYGDDSELRNVPIKGGGDRVAVVQDLYRGREGAEQLLDDWTEPWESTRFEPRELIDAGDGRLLVLSLIHTKGRGSGLEVTERLAQLIEFRRGWVARQSNWLGSWDEGLAAIGLPSVEDPTHPVAEAGSSYDPA
ncbi:hypothetical protein BH20ACT15_BH20ACT15_01080 [soil metagenome]